jgi:hypothetical protein
MLYDNHKELDMSIKDHFHILFVWWLHCMYNNFRKDPTYIAWRWFETEPKHIAVEKRLPIKDNT